MSPSELTIGTAPSRSTSHCPKAAAASTSATHGPLAIRMLGSDREREAGFAAANLCGLCRLCRLRRLGVAKCAAKLRDHEPELAHRQRGRGQDHAVDRNPNAIE